MLLACVLKINGSIKEWNIFYIGTGKVNELIDCFMGYKMVVFQLEIEMGR
jgi:hypothetical protein